jgi:hypothetical protein
MRHNNQVTGDDCIMGQALFQESAELGLCIQKATAANQTLVPRKWGMLKELARPRAACLTQAKNM